jgi:hypothetical protein
MGGMGRGYIGWIYEATITFNPSTVIYKYISPQMDPKVPFCAFFSKFTDLNLFFS